ncbi:hypothetical protein BP6252_03438 [Coleophoma cylindrospora]|uniref:Carboxylic ester hydrolase n=1 Tax=Coleophoma cylindrospora TaxID=1849047 RepID=A0A3D8S7Q8_9HELO|nr:hypothetical protein BP6252_03438 [Coleophoma cylindrospora]
MKVLFILTLVSGVCCVVNWRAGFSLLAVYAVSGGAGLWQNFIDKCQEYEDNGGVGRGINCVGNGVFYLVGAAAAFGGGQAGAMYIANDGVTTQGKRDSFRNSTATRSWDWHAIHASPDRLHDLLANGLPGPVAGYVYNHSDSNLDNSVTVFVESGSGTYAHSSNVTHGVVAFAPSSSNQITNSTNVKRSNYCWDFMGLAANQGTKNIRREAEDSALTRYRAQDLDIDWKTLSSRGDMTAQHECTAARCVLFDSLFWR